MDITERIGMNLAICRHLGKLCDWWGGKTKLLDLYAGAVSEGNPFNTMLSIHWVKLQANLYGNIVFINFNNWKMLLATFVGVMATIKHVHFGATASRADSWIDHY